MDQVSVADEQAPLNQAGKPRLGGWSAAARLGLYAGVAVCVFAGLLLFYVYVYSVHQDLAGIALSGRLAVTLGDAFRDYSMYFPPAERIWFSLAARLSDLTGLRLDLTVVAMTGAAVLFGAGFAYWIRRRTVGASPLFFILSVGALIILPILFKNMIGLREHMVALGLWPYLVLRVSDPDGTRISRRVRLLLGLWIGATLLFKYLYAAVVLLVELADAAIQRRPFLLLRIENIVAGAIVALYLFCWLVLDPSQRTAIGAVFSAIDANLADPAKNALKVAQNLLFALAFLIVLHGFRVPARLMLLGLAAVLAAVFVAWFQGRWYTHHLFPVVMGYAAWWWMARRYLPWWGHAGMALALTYPFIPQFADTSLYQQEVAELDAAMSRAGISVAGKRVGILTMHPSPYNEHLASHGGLRWNASMNNSYVAAELKPFDKPENAHVPPPPVMLEDPGRRMLHDEMLRLWEDMPPDALILDHSTRWPLRYIDVEWTHVFSQEPRFNAILEQYRPVLAHKGGRLQFKYYVRAD